MPRIKKFFLVFSILAAISVLVFLYLQYPNKIKEYLGLKPSQTGTSEHEGSLFTPDEDYVVNEQLGAVSGKTEMNESSKKLYYRFKVYTEEPQQPLDEVYDRFIIREILADKRIVAESLKSGETRVVSLSCPVEKTGLFVSFNMEFASADFDAINEIKVGDLLYTHCLSDVCDSVGTECLLVRRP